MTDPICGMTVTDKNAPTSMYQEKKYAFCSTTCKEKFDNDPARFTELAGKQKEKVGQRG